MPRLGILGGTFDPVHLGHLRAAGHTARALGLDRVLLVPAPRPPHKPADQPADARHRLAMVALATADHEGLEACDIEFQRPGPSYTVDTLSALAEREPDSELYLLVGIDAWLEVSSWHEPQRILGLANVVVLSRPGEPPLAQPPPLPFADSSDACYDSEIGCYRHSSGHLVMTHLLEGLDVSSSRVRECVREHLAIEDLVGPAVAAYIKKHGLYRT